MSAAPQLPGAGSDSLLSESAQLRSTLQAKTYLQGLSPEERKRLLKGSKLSGHRRKHHSTAVAAATARRDELQELLEQEKNRFIGDQAVLAQQPDVSYSSRPSVHETAAWETARLRVRATSLAAENDALKGHVAQLMHQISNMDRSVQVVSNEARARSQRMTEAAAARIAELSDQVERQQRALSEMSAASETLARDNCTVSDELVQLREDKASHTHNMNALQDRVAKLQELYMRDLDQSKAITTVHEDMQQSNLLQLATPEMLAVSTPPAEFPVPSNSKSMRILPALHEIEALQRERDALQGQVKSKAERMAQAEHANAELTRQLAAERRAAKQAGAGAQKQLLGCMRRLQYMVDKAKETEAATKQKDAYIRKLESRLLTQHKAPAASKTKTHSENSKAGSGGPNQGGPTATSKLSKLKTAAHGPAAVPGDPLRAAKEGSPPAAQDFSYETFAIPLQDASNLPAGKAQRAQSAGPVKSSASHKSWQQGLHSRSSSGCFSMDPAQLEADIAALTDAIAAESAGLRGDHLGHVVSHDDYASVMYDMQHAELYGRHEQAPAQTRELDGYGEAHAHPNAGSMQASVQHDMIRTNQHAIQQSIQHDVSFRNQQARQEPTAAEPRWAQSRDQEAVYARPRSRANAESTRVEADADLDGELSLTWHRRQSEEEWLADAAEAKLLGLASRPRTAASTAQQDFEPRQQQLASQNKGRSQGLRQTDAQSTAQQQQASSSSEGRAAVEQLTQPLWASGRSEGTRLAQQHTQPMQASSRGEGRAAVEQHPQPMQARGEGRPASEQHTQPLRASHRSEDRVLIQQQAQPVQQHAQPASDEGRVSAQQHTQPTPAQRTDADRPVAEGAHSRSREMLRAALHNLAQHDDSPPSSTQHSAASSFDGASQSAPVTSITANECFDGSALFGGASSASINANSSAQWRSLPDHLQQNQVGVVTHQQSFLQQAVSSSGRVRESSQARDGLETVSGKHQAASKAAGTAAGSTAQAGSQTMARHCQMDSDAAGAAAMSNARAKSEAVHGSMDLGAAGPAVASSARAGTVPGNRSSSDPPAAQAAAAVSTKERVMTLEQLESRIANLNTSLLRDPALCQDGIPQPRDHKAQPAMTVWQKLTRPRQSETADSGASCCSSVSDVESDLEDRNDEARMHASSSCRPKASYAPAAPLESPPSTGFRHYSGAQRRRSQDCSSSEGRLLDWANASPPDESPLHQQQQHIHSFKSQARHGSKRQQQQQHASSSCSESHASGQSTIGTRRLTMLQSPAALLPSRRLPKDATSLHEGMHIKLSPVANSWRMYADSQDSQ